MKKLFLTLIAIVATSLAGMAQISLSDAYTSLVNMPGMRESKATTVQIDANTQIQNLQTVTAKGRSHAQEFIYTIESLPLQNVLLSANNHKDLAMVFTEPAVNGVYNVLVIASDTPAGIYTASYGQTNQAGVEAIRNCCVSMDGSEIVIVPTPEAEEVEFISFTEYVAE